MERFGSQYGLTELNNKLFRFALDGSGWVQINSTQGTVPSSRYAPGMGLYRGLIYVCGGVGVSG